MKLLIIDDSALMRSALTQLFGARPGWEVHSARDGVTGLRACRELRPSVVIMDVNMPNMDGLTCLAHIMAECPTRVLMFSSLTEDGAATSLEALYIGAVDCLAKPAANFMDNAAQQAALLAAVEAASRATPRSGAARAVRMSMVPKAPRARPATPSKPPAAVQAVLAPGLVLVGCSTGGPRALEELLAGLPAELPWPLVIAQHIPGSFTGPLAARLDGLCRLTVREVRNLTLAEVGHVYLARGDADLLITRRTRGFCLMPAPSDPLFAWHPSVERMVRSALQCSTAQELIGVQLTGMGDDGAAAFTTLRERGGHTIAESPETTVVNGMPGALVARGGAERVLPLPQIARAVARWL